MMNINKTYINNTTVNNHIKLFLKKKTVNKISTCRFRLTC